MAPRLGALGSSRTILVVDELAIVAVVGFAGAEN